VLFQPFISTLDIDNSDQRRAHHPRDPRHNEACYINRNTCTRRHWTCTSSVSGIEMLAAMREEHWNTMQTWEHAMHLQCSQPRPVNADEQMRMRFM